MSRGSPEALARGDQPLPICKYVIKSMFVYSSIPPSQKNSCSSPPPPPKNILSRVSPEALARHVNPLQYLNKYVSIFFPHPPPTHKKSALPAPPLKKKTKSTLKNKMSRAGVPLSHRPDDFIPYKNKTL